MADHELLSIPQGRTYDSPPYQTIANDGSGKIVTAINYSEEVPVGGPPIITEVGGKVVEIPRVNHVSGVEILD